MNKISQVFHNGKAFIPYITAGYPSLAKTEELILAMAEVGVDLIELGIPFSDPVAEGPVIEKAHIHALAQGVTTDEIFAMLARLRKTCHIPIALMTYANPIFVYGKAKFMEKCRQLDVAGVIVPDVPFEERDEFRPYCAEAGVAFISLITPTSKERIQMIAREAEGFIYCVSSMGVTGIRQELDDYVGEMIKSVKEVQDIPCAIGFGISTPEQGAQMAQHSDGIIVGSAIMDIVAKTGMDCIELVKEYIIKMKEALA